VKFGLLFGITPQPVRAEIDLPTLVIDPEDMVTVFFELSFREVLRLLEPFEDAALSDDRPEIDHTLITVGEDELEDGM
jgi:hypothetical protein